MQCNTRIVPVVGNFKKTKNCTTELNRLPSKTFFHTKYYRNRCSNKNFVIINKLYKKVTVVLQRNRYRWLHDCFPNLLAPYYCYQEIHTIYKTAEAEKNLCEVEKKSVPCSWRSIHSNYMHRNQKAIQNQKTKKFSVSSLDWFCTDDCWFRWGISERYKSWNYFLVIKN